MQLKRALKFQLKNQKIGMTREQSALSYRRDSFLLHNGRCHDRHGRLQKTGLKSMHTQGKRQ